MNVPIRASTRQHLVDTKDVERVHTNPQVERVFASGLCYILVGADTRSLERFARELLILVGDKVTAEGETHRPKHASGRGQRYGSEEEIVSAFRS
jgi:hypothetical protein